MKIIMNDNFTKFKKSAGLFIKTGIISLFVGIICGIVGVAFHLAVDFVTEFRGENPWVLYTLPVLGAVIAFMYAKFNPGDKGTDGIFVAAENGDKLPIAIALQFLSARCLPTLAAVLPAERVPLCSWAAVSQVILRIF